MLVPLNNGAGPPETCKYWFTICIVSISWLHRVWTHDRESYNYYNAGANSSTPITILISRHLTMAPRNVLHRSCNCGPSIFQQLIHKNSVVLVCERTIPTELPPLVSEVSAKFCGWMLTPCRRDGFLRPYSRIF
jgi:hypothetical protein